MEFTSVNKVFEAAFKKNWVRPAISNYQGETLCFRDVARRMEKLHIMFEPQKNSLDRTTKKP